MSTPFETLRSGLMRFDCLLKIDILPPDPDMGAGWELDVFFVDLYPRPQDKEHVERELVGEGWDLDEEARTTLGHWQRWRYARDPKGQVRRAMAVLVGEGAVALCAAPRIEFTEADLDAMAA